MILPPSDYELAVARARKAIGGTAQRAFCARHGSLVGEIRYTPEGPLFCAQVPVESGSGAREYLRALREEAAQRIPPVMYEVRCLIDRADEADDPPMAWCKRGGHRIVLGPTDFTSHSAGKIRVKN